jgi:ABC-type transport system substrate-binding protein
VSVKLTAPHSGFLNGLADWRNTIIPRDFVEKGGDFKNPTALVGTGPWTCETFQDNVTAVFKPNPKYWEKDDSGGQLPYLDAQQWVWVPDPLSNETAFAQGKVDYLYGQGKVTSDTIKKVAPNAQQVNWVFGNWEHFRFNCKKAPFTDARVREAIFRVIDYKGMSDSYYGSGLWDYTGPLGPAFPEGIPSDQIAKMPGYDPDTKQQDIKDAKAMMSAAGFADGNISFKIYVGFQASGPAYEKAIRAQSDLKTAWPAMNVTVDVPPDPVTFSKKQVAGDFDVISYTLFPAPDAVIEMQQNESSKGSRNYGGFSNADIDSALAKAATQLDKNERKATLTSVQKDLINTYMPTIHTDQPRQVVYFQPKVQNTTGYGGQLGGGASYDTEWQSRKMWFKT